MILYWPTVQKAPEDVKNVPVDWTDLLGGNTSAVTAHHAWTAPGDLDAYAVEDEVPPGIAGVVTTDNGMIGLVQTVQISQGAPDAYSLIACRITLADGTDLTRGFQVNVR